MLLGSRRSGRFTRRRDVGARMPKACCLQIFGKGFGKFSVLVVALIVSIYSFPLVNVLAAEPITFTLEGNYGSGPVNSSNSPKALYGGLSVSEDDVRKYFTTGDTLTFTLDDIVYKSYSVNGSGSVSITDTSFNGNISMRYNAVGGSSSYQTFTKGQEVSVSYGGGGIYFSFLPACGSFTNSGISVSYCNVYVDVSFTVPSQPLSDNEALNGINDKMQEQLDQDKKFHDEDIQKGEESGSDASKMVDDLTDQVKTKWEILFYPIEFTKKFLALFTSSSGGSTTIEFPAFSLEVDGQSYQVWNSYTYDLGTLKDDFSILFTGLHMIVGVIEVGWFIKYLYRKYDEVFGTGGESS